MRTPTANAELVAAALLDMSKQRIRVATGAAAGIRTEKADGRDIRPSAVRITALLAEASDLEHIANELAAGRLVITAPLPANAAELAAASIAAHQAQLTAPPAAGRDTAVTELPADTNPPNPLIGLPDEEDSPIDDDDVEEIPLPGGI